MTSEDRTLCPPGRTKMASIEAARALAAVAVVLMHAANLMSVEHFSGHIGMGRVFDFGYVGVDFFFVLSGFIITYIHYADIGRPGMIGRYLWRRFSRIFPIYWFILLLVILVTTLARMTQGKSPGFEIGVEDIAGTVFLMMSGDDPKYVGVAWSLQFEVMFYLAFCVLLIHARAGAMLFLAWGAYVLLHVVGWASPRLPFQLSNPHCFQFLVGVCVGAIARRHPLQTRVGMLLPSVLGFVLATLFEVDGPFERHSGPGRIALGLAAAFVLATLVGLERQQLLKTPAWLARMGSVSYTIYLGHILFINSTYMVLLKIGLYHALPESLVYVIAVTVALFGTILLGVFVELPMVGALKDRFFQRHAAHVPIKIGA